MLVSLKQEITCPLCLDVFKRPKKLPCDHVYCEECLFGLARAKKGAASNTITCPECRTPAEVSAGDCSHFPTPFHMNRLIEMYENGIREVEGTSAERVIEDVDGGSGTAEPADCQTHKGKPLSLYCETCDKLVCHDCVLFSCAKLQHCYDYVGDVLEKHKSALTASLLTVQDLQLRMKETLKLTEDIASNIGKEEEKVVGEVDAAFAALFDILRDEKSALTAKLKKKFEDAKTLNSVKRSEVVAICAKLREVLSAGNPNQDKSEVSFFTELKARRSVVEGVIEAALAVEHPNPMVLPDTKFTMIKPDKLRELCKSSTSTYSDEHISFECHFEGSINWNGVPLETITMVTLGARTPFPKVYAHLYCVHSKKKYPLLVHREGHQCMLAMHPEERGRHELIIKHGRKHISVSPVKLNVVNHPSPSLVPRMSGFFNKPMGIKCEGEQVYVSEMGSGLILLRPRTLEVLSTVRIPDIWEVYVDFKSGLIYSTDNHHNTLKVMTMDVQLRKCVGGKGTQPGQFNWPNGIRCSKEGEIYVCDTMNSRIQVFDKDLNFLRLINSMVLVNPDDLDFDKEGNLYVANQGAHNIAVLTSHGRLLRTIGTRGTGPGRLDNPISVAVHGNLVYVTDTGNSRISVFTTDGKFVSVFGKGVLGNPECIAIDRDGYVYVSDSRSKVVIF